MASARILSRRVWKPIAYASTVVAIGGASVYLYSGRHESERPEASVSVRRDHKGVITPPRFPKIKSRAEQIELLRRSAKVMTPLQTQSTSSSHEDVYDLLVIGGGATGTGIALDAATRGLKVALVERDDFASGTSSKSTKLVHGGVRYLEKAVWNLDYGQYQLVREALRERKNFLYTAPHLSSALPVMLPIKTWWEAPYFWAGTKAYDFLAGGEGLGSSYYLGRQKALDAFPILKKDNLLGALVYYDGQHNDARMNTSLALTAALYGATVVNHMEVTGLEKDANGRLVGARVRDRIPERDAEGALQEDFTVRARGIINATGPFVDAIEQMDQPTKKNMIAPSLGVHVMLPGHLSPNRMGLLDPATSDGRVMFFLPWQGNVIAGTTDTPCNIEKDPIATEDDISWILNEIRHYITDDVQIERKDVLAAWSGIRPLVKDPKAKNTESLIRNHLVTVSPSGLLTCAGGKWTTYRQMAEDAVDEAIKTFQLKPRPQPAVSISDIDGDATSTVFDGTCSTHNLRLIGAHGFSKTLPVNLIQHFNLSPDVASHLASSYGDRAWEVAALASPSRYPEHYPYHGNRISPLFPYIDGEVRYAVRQEYACSAVDVLARRTRLSFLNVNAALEALPAVVDLMGDELRWSQARKELEWQDTVKFLRSMGLPQAQIGITRQQVLDGEHRSGMKATTLRRDVEVPRAHIAVAEDVLGQLAS